MKHKGKGLFYKTSRDKHLGEVIRLRGEGLGYKRDAKKIGLSSNLVRQWVFEAIEKGGLRRVIFPLPLTNPAEFFACVKN